MLNPKTVCRIAAGASKSVGIYTNTSCNCRCKMCDIWKLNKEILPFEVAQHAVKVLVSKGFTFLFIAGGEPLLYPHIFELIEYATRMGMVTQILTNGTIMNKQMATRLKKAGVGVVTISVDHYNPSIAEEIRGHKNILDKIKKTVKILKSESIVTTAETVISKYNYKDSEKVVDFINHDIGVPMSFCYPLQSLGFYPLGNETGIVDFSNRELVDIFSEIFKLKKSGRYILNNHKYILEVIRKLNGTNPLILCRAGKDILVVDYKGDVYPCFYKNKICTVGELENVNIEEHYAPCDQCLAQCFREPSIFYENGPIGSYAYAREVLLDSRNVGQLVKKILN